MKLKFDSMFMIKGQGVVLSGAVQEGDISIGQKITLISPNSSFDTRVKGLECDRKIIPKAILGQQVAVMLDESVFLHIKNGIRKIPDSFSYEVDSVTAINCKAKWWHFW